MVNWDPVDQTVLGKNPQIMKIMKQYSSNSSCLKFFGYSVIPSVGAKKYLDSPTLTVPVDRHSHDFFFLTFCIFMYCALNSFSDPDLHRFASRIGISRLNADPDPAA
jgi:hypothetical protein